MDSYVLYSPEGASPIQLGSWLRADPGPDFGQTGLVRPNVVMTPYSEGALAFEQSDPRTMRFPLLLGSNGAWSGLEGLHSLLRDNARPGAYVDIQPESVPSSEAVRFDVLSGRLIPEYVVGHQRVNRRMATLELTTGPYGYWPTWMLLASAASIGLPAQGIPITLDPASVIGDAPAWGRLVIAPTVGTSYPQGTWSPDMVGWSLSGKPSFVSFRPAASFSPSLAGILGSRIADAFAPGSQNNRILPVPTPGLWTQIQVGTVGSALEPAYRGRYRAFAYARVSPSGPPVQLTLDAAVLRGEMLASAQRVATVNPGAWAASYVPQSSPAHTLVDLGEITLPPVASGLRQTYALRLWAMQPSPGPSMLVEFSGLQLMPMDGAHGFLQRGLTQPTTYTGDSYLGSFLPTIGRLDLDGYSRRAVIAETAPDRASSNPLQTVLGHHRGGFPVLGASTVKLDMMGGMRKLTGNAVGSYPQILSAFNPWAYYRFEESAGPTVTDSLGSWHGSYTSIQLSGPGVAGNAPSFNDTGYALVPSLGAGIMATVWTLAVWFTHTATVSAGSYDTLYARGDNGLALRLHYAAQFNRSGALILRSGGNTGDITVGPADDVNLAASPVLLVHVHHPGSAYANYFLAIPGKGATFLASKQIQDGIGSIPASGPLGIGAWGNGAQPYANGLLDELSIHMGTAWDITTVASVFVAKASPPDDSGPSHNPIARTAPAWTSYSLLYQPRFQFLKGI